MASSVLDVGGQEGVSGSKVVGEKVVGVYIRFLVPLLVERVLMLCVRLGGVREASGNENEWDQVWRISVAAGNRC